MSTDFSMWTEIFICHDAGNEHFSYHRALPARSSNCGNQISKIPLSEVLQPSFRRTITICRPSTEVPISQRDIHYAVLCGHQRMRKRLNNFVSVEERPRRRNKTDQQTCAPSSRIDVIVGRDCP